MQYHIKVVSTGECIASFVNESDRDICLSALYEYHDDLPDDYFLAEDGDLFPVFC